MASNAGKVASNVLVVAVWLLFLYVLIKWLPGLVSSVRAPGASGPLSLYGGGGYDGQAYAQGQYNGGFTPSQILSSPFASSLSPQSITNLEGLSYAAAGRNFDGSPYNDAQNAQLISNLDFVNNELNNALAGQSIAYQPLLNVPDSDLLSFTPGPDEAISSADTAGPQQDIASLLDPTIFDVSDLLTDGAYS